MAGGGQLLHLRLSLPHTPADSIADLLGGLRKAEQELRKSAKWGAVGIVDWVRVLHVRWSPVHGWHPHYHLTAFVPGGVEVDIDRVTRTLQGAWRDRLYRAGFAKARRSHGLFARVFTSALKATYAWSWADDEPDDEEYNAQVSLGHDYDPNHLDDDGESWALWQLAEAAVNGDQQAWRLWEDLCRALKGVPTVKASRMLDRLWKEHEAGEPEPEFEDLGEPVVMVAAGLWERARREGVTELGLELGRTSGLEALAQWWATELNVALELDVGMCPPLLALKGR